MLPRKFNDLTELPLPSRGFCFLRNGVSPWRLITPERIAFNSYAPPFNASQDLNIS
jgi:hypothetical protein